MGAGAVVAGVAASSQGVSHSSYSSNPVENYRGEGRSKCKCGHSIIHHFILAKSSRCTLEGCLCKEWNEDKEIK